MATTSEDEATQAQIGVIEEYLAVEQTVELLYSSERDGATAPLEAFDRALRGALRSDAYDRVRALFTGGMDSPAFEGRFALDNLMARAEGFWRDRCRPDPNPVRG